VTAHFRSFGHSVHHLSIQIIEPCKLESTIYRRTRERFWQDLIKPEINKQYTFRYKSSNLPNEFNLKHGGNSKKRNFKPYRRTQ
jgi:hypothetical protein